MSGQVAMVVSGSPGAIHDPVPATDEVADPLRIWVEDHADFLLRVATRLTGQVAAAEDLVQEAFLIAHRRRDELSPGLSPRAWLYRVVVNLVQHHRRSLARRARLAGALSAEGATAPASAEAPDRAAERAEEAQRVRACVARLPLKHREVFTLYELEGLEGAEIARFLGLPENTVWSRLRHARSKFKKLWHRAERERRRS